MVVAGKKICPCCGGKLRYYDTVKRVVRTKLRKTKVIIFYNFDYELEILKSLYYGDGCEIAEWNGHKHQPIANLLKK